MSRPRAFIRSFVTWMTVRYAISGVINGTFYLGTPLLLNAEFGIPLEACLPVIFVLAVMLQFTLQRLFVFRHVPEFALSVRRQMLWFVMIAAIQYPASALATALLPGLLGVRERVVYVVATLTIAFLTFVFLRRNVFHPRETGSPPLPDTVIADGLIPEPASAGAPSRHGAQRSTESSAPRTRSRKRSVSASDSGVPIS